MLGRTSCCPINQVTQGGSIMLTKIKTQKLTPKNSHAESQSLNKYFQNGLYFIYICRAMQPGCAGTTPNYPQSTTTNLQIVLNTPKTSLLKSSLIKHCTCQSFLLKTSQIETFSPKIFSGHSCHLKSKIPLK